MPDRNLLMVTYHFPPSAASGSFRLLGFARHLPAQGWGTSVVAPPGLPWEPVDVGLSARVPGETAVYRVPYLKSRVARKLVRFAGWLPRAARACGKAVAEQRPSAVLTSGPPHEVHWLGYWLKRKYGLPWVADFRDPWHPEGGSENRTSLAWWWTHRQESLVFHNGDAILANAPGACRSFQNRYPKLADKFVTLPNGYDRETFEAVAGEVPPREAGGPFRLVHAGAIYVGRDPLPVLDAIQTLTQSESSMARSWDVRFLGPPPENGMDLQSAANARGLADCVRVAGQVPYDRALREMAGADVLLLMDSPGRMVGVPAKLYEYIGAGRPVLALGERGGDLANVLETSGIPHRIAPPGDPSAIASALGELAAVAGSAGPSSATRDDHPYGREALAGRLASVLDRCVRDEEERGRGPSAAFAQRQAASVGIGDA